MPDMLIGAYGFFMTALSSISLPDSVKTIGENAFGNSVLLSEVKFGPGSQLSELGHRAFALTDIQRFDGPSKLTKVGPAAFAHSKVRTVSLPEKVDRLPRLIFFSWKSLEHVITHLTSTVTIAKRAFDEVNESMTIHAPHRDRFRGHEALKVTDARPVLTDLTAESSNGRRASRGS
jgi:hypothetical protein